MVDVLLREQGARGSREVRRAQGSGRFVAVADEHRFRRTQRTQAVGEQPRNPERHLAFHDRRGRADLEPAFLQLRPTPPEVAGIERDA